MLKSLPRPLPHFLKKGFPPAAGGGISIFQPWDGAHHGSIPARGNAISLPDRVLPPVHENQRVIDFSTIRILFTNTEAPEDFTEQFLRFHLPGHFADGIECNSQINGRKFRALPRT